jgi:hypothetical protein
MLHEARDRQKLVDDVQHLRDMQHKVDSEYQVIAESEDYRLPFLPVLESIQNAASVCDKQ